MFATKSPSQRLAGTEGGAVSEGARRWEHFWGGQGAGELQVCQSRGILAQTLTSSVALSKDITILCLDFLICTMG